MNEQNPERGQPTLDDLLTANKARFDKIFATRMAEPGLGAPGAGTGEAPENAPKNMPLAGAAAPEARDVTAQLNARFGGAWSSEILEHDAARGGVTVLVKLTVGDITKMQFGAARANGDAGRALQRAADDALAKCAAMMTDAAPLAPPAPTAALQTTIGPAGTKATPPPAAAAMRHARRGEAAGQLDVVAANLIEKALENACHEMAAVLNRAALSPAIGAQHGNGPMITDAQGRMLNGQGGSCIPQLLKAGKIDPRPGDLMLLADPFECGGAVNQINDWFILAPVYFQDALVGFVSTFAHMADVGGPAPGSMAATATSIFGEGLRIPPIKLYDGGTLNQPALDLILANTRGKEVMRGDLMAAIAGCRAGERAVMALCDRFGAETYERGCEALLSRTERAMAALIKQNLPIEPQSFEDYVDDDGCGNGPFKITLAVWREGEHAYFDWTGTAAQAPGPINFYLHDGLFKLFIGIYMSNLFGVKIPMNAGFHDLIHVTLPKGSLVQPDFPAALGCRGHTLSRQFDVLGAVLGRSARDTSTAAGYGAKPQFHYTGIDQSGQRFQIMESLPGGMAGRAGGDGMDGRSLWPFERTLPTELIEAYYPLVIERYGAVMGSGGAGRHRGGNGIEKVYRLLAAGLVSIHDDRHESHPWGVQGGKPGAVSAKWLIRDGGEQSPLPAKVENLKVQAGDRIIFRTAGGGGWGDPLAREPVAVRADVARRLLSLAAAKEDHGVVLIGEDLEIDRAATVELRAGLMRNRRPPSAFDFGPRRGNGSGG